jgi:hypothetical protein
MQLLADNDTHQRAGARCYEYKTDPTAGSVACDCSSRSGSTLIMLPSTIPQDSRRECVRIVVNVLAKVVNKAITTIIMKTGDLIRR